MNDIYDWKLYFKFAQELVFQQNSGNDEQTIYRVAISRAYYAAFNVALIYMERPKIKNRIGLRCGTSHDNLIKNYKGVNFGDKEFQAKCNAIGNKLFYLKQERCWADYKATGVADMKKIRKDFAYAEQIIEGVEQLEGNSRQ